MVAGGDECNADVTEKHNGPFFSRGWARRIGCIVRRVSWRENRPGTGAAAAAWRAETPALPVEKAAPGGACGRCGSLSRGLTPGAAMCTGQAFFRKSGFSGASRGFVTLRQGYVMLLSGLQGLKYLFRDD
jgi:hypothetical protein